MMFSCIYSFDVPMSDSVERLKPPHARKLWECTEFAQL